MDSEQKEADNLVSTYFVWFLLSSRPKVIKVIRQGSLQKISKKFISDTCTKGSIHHFFPKQMGLIKPIPMKTQLNKDGDFSPYHKAINQTNSSYMLMLSSKIEIKCPLLLINFTVHLRALYSK